MRVPIPMVTIIQSGRSAPGKLNCVKEFMVVPKPGMPIADVCFDILDFSFTCWFDTFKLLCSCPKPNSYFLINEIKVCTKELWKLIKYIYCGTLHVFCEIAIRGGHCLQKNKINFRWSKIHFVCRVWNTARKSTAMWPKP